LKFKPAGFGEEDSNIFSAYFSSSLGQGHCPSFDKF
jgi:hypothetical protein